MKGRCFIIRFTSILTVLSASLYLACGSAEASQFSSPLQNRLQAILKGHDIKGTLNIATDDVPAPGLRNIGLHISVIKEVELPSGEFTSTEVCAFDKQWPLYDMRTDNDGARFSVDKCSVILNGKESTVAIYSGAILVHITSRGFLPESDAKVLGTAATLQINGDNKSFQEFGNAAGSRDLQTRNLVTSMRPVYGGPSAPSETISVWVDMNELQ